ncbi:WecB/TagA/CpsF family glycosyltransferase [Galactobacter sp.]|uniref:WecB/TagA/CpsF family glycosyltransferase n=1 Tax=Galactobacter sp. TaxID=2676125 RepID=UPI0025C42D5F|nr:WecB/TagA/CpsF family glycosyltransferase [Galactobacter sp.]
MLAPRAVTVSGVKVRAFTQSALTQTVTTLAQSPGTDVLVGVNAHVCNLARRDPDLRGFLDKALNYADGQSVVWSARLLGMPVPQRLATTDVAEPILRSAAAAGLPIYFFGAQPGIADAAATILRSRIPGLKLRTHHGYVKDEETAALLTDIAEHGTKILFVGLGDPTQERWVAAHAEQLPPVVLTCGGLFDWLSGHHRRAPHWMIDAGLEWLWRFMIEPKRLARRYLVGNPSFMLAVARERLLLRNRARA